MSLVFRPRQFRDKNGDLIEIEPLTVTDIFATEDGEVQMEFAPQITVSFYNLDELQKEVEQRYEWGHITNAKNITKGLRDIIQLTECVKSAQDGKWSHHSEEELKGLKEKLRSLEA